MFVPPERTKQETHAAVKERIAELELSGAIAGGDAPRIRRRLLRWWQVFASRLGQAKDLYHTIDTTEVRPKVQRMYSQSVPQQVETKKQVQASLDRGLIEPSASNWATSCVLVKKKDASWRFAIDYRELNSVTEADVYPVPRVDETLDTLAGARYYTALDLTSGFW